jgi:hypothetical protein
MSDAGTGLMLPVPIVRASFVRIIKWDKRNRQCLVWSPSMRSASEAHDLPLAGCGRSRSPVAN